MEMCLMDDMKVITFHAFMLLLLIGCSRGLNSTIQASGPAQETLAQ
jgi:hypothetical protein